MASELVQIVRIIVPFSENEKCELLVNCINDIHNNKEKYKEYEHVFVFKNYTQRKLEMVGQLVWLSKESIKSNFKGLPIEYPLFTDVRDIVYQWHRFKNKDDIIFHFTTMSTHAYDHSKLSAVRVVADEKMSDAPPSGVERIRSFKIIFKRSPEKFLIQEEILMKLRNLSPTFLIYADDMDNTFEGALYFKSARHLSSISKNLKDFEVSELTEKNRLDYYKSLKRNETYTYEGEPPTNCYSLFEHAKKM
jgi:hypothetical protein